jgi:hypothetical protein
MVVISVLKIEIFTDDSVKLPVGQSAEDPIYTFERVFEGPDHLSVVEFPDSYFSMDFAGLDYNMPKINNLGSNLINMSFPEIEMVDKSADGIAAASDIINRETDVLNGVISNAMLLANSGNAPRKKISSDAVYGVASKAKLIIANATNTFNINTVVAKTQLNAGLSGNKNPWDEPVPFKPIDPALMQVYAQTVRFLENSVCKGRVPIVEKNPITGRRGKTNNGTQIQTDSLWRNYMYLDKNNKVKLGISHFVSSDEQSTGIIKLTNGATLTGWRTKDRPGLTTSLASDGPGLTDQQVEALFLSDLSGPIKEIQKLLGVIRWNYLWENDQCMLIICIDMLYKKKEIKNIADIATFNRNFAAFLNGTGGDYIGSGLGLQMGVPPNSKNILRRDRLDLWSSPFANVSNYDYRLQKQSELTALTLDVYSVVSNGAQRNNAIMQLFINKQPLLFNGGNEYYFPFTDGKGITKQVNFWNECNPNNLQLREYMRTR